MPTRRALPAKLPEFIVDSPATLGECLEHLKTQAHVGFDTEFVGEETYRPDLCLIQISTHEHLYLIDPLKCGSLEAFWSLLADPSRQVIVHAGREELRACTFALSRPPAHVFDVQIAAGLVGYTYPIGYSALTYEVIGVRTSKGETLTDWRRRPLSPAQQRYAFDDVRYLLPLWKKLHEKLRRLNREDWAAEEFAAFVRRSVHDEPAVERWRKLKGLGALSRRELAVARELYVWRDSVADRQNRPPRSVLRDEILVEIARRGPSREEDVATIRGLAKGLIPSLLGAVRKAKNLLPAEYPEPGERDSDPPHVQMLASLLNVVLTEWCQRNQIAPNQVATMTDLKNVVRGRQRGRAERYDSPLFSGWRQRVVLPELEAFLDGQRTLVVEDPSKPQPIRVSSVNGVA